MLLKSMTDPGFLVTAQVLLVVLTLAQPLSQSLQKKAMDLKSAVDSVDDFIAALQSDLDGGIDTIFIDLFNCAEEPYGEKTSMPRLVGRQNFRNNVPAASALEYYYRAMFLQFIDNCLLQMRERFKHHHSQSLQLVYLMPALCDKRSFSNIKGRVIFYAQCLPCSLDPVEAEFLRWHHYWRRCQQPDAAAEKPSAVIEALHVANQLSTYPAIFTLLLIFATLPITTAMCERSFSVL